MTPPQTPQPSAPASAPSPPGRGSGSTKGRSRVLVFALAAGALLVASATFAFSGLVPGRDSSVDAVPFEPATYTADAVGRVTSLASVGDLAVPSPVNGALPRGTEERAEAALDAAIVQATAAFQQALEDAGLPEVPADYVQGAVPAVTVPDASAYLDGSFAGTLPTGPVAGGLTGTVFTAQPSPVGPRSSTLPIADVLAQVEGALQQVRDALGVEDLPPLPPLPVGGDVPAQAGDAQDTVEPDEEGARRADLHASALLGATSDAYGATSTELTALLASYQKLAALVAQAVEDTRAIEEATAAGIEADLEDRLDAIEAEASKLTGQANRLASEHRKLADRQHAAAEAAIQSALELQLDAIEDARLAALANVTASAASLQRQAAASKAEVQDLVASAVVQLESDGSVEALAGVEAVRAAGDAAIQKIDRATQAQVDAIVSSRPGIEADAEAAVAALTEQAEAGIAGLEGTHDDALALAADVKAYLLAVAQAQAELAQQQETEAAQEALMALEETVDAHVEGLVEGGLKATAKADEVLAMTTELVQQVQDTASTQVGKDLLYITEVSEDYGRVPTEERKERASHWSSTAANLEGLLDSTLTAGLNIERLAQRAVAAASQAEAELQAMA